MDGIKDCCKPEAGNLVAHSVRGEDGKLREDVIVNICSDCGCRHFEWTVDPLHLNLSGAEIS